MKDLQAYANNNGMAYVADCIKNMEDLTMNDFRPEEIDMSDCIQMVTTRKLDADGKPIKDLEGNELRDEVKVITHADRQDEKNEIQKHRIRFKEGKYRKFEGNKKICLSSTELQMCPGVHANQKNSSFPCGNTSQHSVWNPCCCNDIVIVVVTSDDQIWKVVVELLYVIH